jgi:hypothetical protein
MGDGGVHTVLVGRPEVKRLLSSSTLGWEDNVKIDLQKVQLGGMDCIDLQMACS